jgi:hypothetical protein
MMSTRFITLRLTLINNIPTWQIWVDGLVVKQFLNKEDAQDYFNRYYKAESE